MDTMDVKGQASVEYLLLALVFLIILGSVTVPLVGNAITNSEDVSHSSDASAAINSIANAVGIVYSNGPGAKRTINVYFSRGGALTYNSATSAIQMLVYIDSTSTNKVVDANVPINVTLNGANSATVNNLTNYNATVTWASGTSNVNVALTPS